MAGALFSTDRGRVSSLPTAKKFAPIKLEDDVLALPFVRDTTRDEQRTGMPRRLFWCVSPSGDVLVDDETGEQYARMALDFMAETGTSFIVQWAVHDMMRLGREFSALEIGFLSWLTKNAMVAHKVHLWTFQRREVV